MNRALIITIGTLILLMALGVWMYLMLFGTPKSSGEVFTNLSFSTNNQGITVTPDEQGGDSSSIEALVDTKTGKLRQLTTRPVAGYATASTTAGFVVRYAERGTGHVYEINLATGEEKVISRTTVPQVAEAYFSPDTRSVALLSYSSNGTTVFVGTLTEGGELNGTTLEPGAENLAFLDAATLRYSIARNGKTTGYEQDLTAGTRRELFSLNFTELRADWGPELSKTYLSTKPSQRLLGYLYTTKNNVLTPVVEPAYGLTALIADQQQVVTYLSQGSYRSYILSFNEKHPLPTLVLKEKCAFDNNHPGYLWCAAPLKSQGNNLVDDWYKGLASFNDYIWLINTQDQTSQLLLSPEKEAGRPVDAIDLTLSTDSSNLFFKNKIDQTLWLYDLTVK